MSIYEKYNQALKLLSDMANDLSTEGDRRFIEQKRICEQLKQEIIFCEQRSSYIARI